MPQLLLTSATALAALVLAAYAGPSSAAEDASAKTGAAACLSRPLPQRSSAQTVEVRTRDGDGVSSSLRARILWKRLADGRHAGVMRLLEPAEVADMSVLVRETESGSLARSGARGTEVFLYLPELRRVRRVSVHQATTSLFGTAFGYSDFDRLQGQVRESRFETLGEVTYRGRSAWLVQAHPPGDEPSYSKILTHIDMQTCLPLHVEFHDAKGELTKVLDADPERFARVQGIWIARSIRMRSLHDGVESELILHSIEFDGDVSEEAFAPANLAEEF